MRHRMKYIVIPRIVPANARLSMSAPIATRQRLSL